MASKNAQKELERGLADLGYEFTRRNERRQVNFYNKPGQAEIAVRDCLAEYAAKRLIEAAKKANGVATQKGASKRNAGQVKERQAIDRERARAGTMRLDTERAAIEVELEQMRQRAFGGLNVSRFDAGRLRARLTEIEDERRYYAALMTEVPTTGNTVKHRS